MKRRLIGLLAAGLLLAACGSVSAASALRSWVSQSAFARGSATLHRDALHAATTLRTASASAFQLHTVCAVLLVDSESANASLPTPDDQTTTLLGKAYDLLGSGANVCYHAGSNAAHRTQALSLLEAGSARLAQANLRISAATAGG